MRVASDPRSKDVTATLACGGCAQVRDAGSGFGDVPGMMKSKRLYKQKNMDDENAPNPSTPKS